MDPLTVNPGLAWLQVKALTIYELGREIPIQVTQRRHLHGT